MADRKKIYCEVLEGVTFSDRCLFKLSKIIEGNKTCENCILRQFERIKSGKAGRSSANDINDIKDIKVIKDINISKGINMTRVTNGPKGISKRRRRTKARPKGKPGPIADAPPDPEQPYTVQGLSKLLGKSKRRIQELALLGELPGHKVGRTWQFPKEEIDKWLSEKEHRNDNVMTSSLKADQDGQGSSQPEET